MKTIEICNECGKDVSWKSGEYVNRVPDTNDYQTRKKDGKPFPLGDFICAECDDYLNKLTEEGNARNKRNSD